MEKIQYDRLYSKMTDAEKAICNDTKLQIAFLIASKNEVDSEYNNAIDRLRFQFEVYLNSIKQNLKVNNLW